MKKGDIVSVIFPFSDLSDSKRRPALVLHVRLDDVILAFITSKINNAEESTILILKTDYNNLQADSLIILGKIFTGNRSLIKGKIGKIESMYYSKINEVIKEILFFE